MSAGNNSGHTHCAFITGGASGIGACTAKLFLDRGWSVALVDNDCEQGIATARELAAYGPVSFVACDVSQPTEIEKAVAETIAFYGRICLLVNNAALLGPSDLLTSRDDDLSQV